MAIELSQFVKNIKELKRVLPQVVKYLLFSDEALKLINANIEAWNKGLMPSGETITNNFTGSTSYGQRWGEIRQNENKPTDHYYLQFSGQFAKSLVLEVEIKNLNVSLNIVSKGQAMKEDDLNAMFGDIIGIPSEALENFFKWFEIELVKEINERLFKA